MLALSYRKCDPDNHRRILPKLRFLEDRFGVVAHIFMIREAEFIAVVLMNMPDVWVMTPCRLVYSYQSFGETCFFNLQNGHGRVTFTFTSRGT
jgi:hypothetical protein